jgi:molecular chaperone GrpE
MTNHKDNGPEKGDKTNDKPKDRRVVVEFDRAERAAAAAAAPSSPEDEAMDANASTPDTQKPAAGADPAIDRTTADLLEQIGRLKSDKDDLARTMVQRQADFENYRKRIERERQEESRRGVGRMIEDLIPVLDAFDLALKAHDSPDYDEHRKGLELIYRQLWESLTKHGLERIAAAGKTFDPHFHQAIERVETSEHPDGAILEVFQEGYLYHGRVLRPSIVRVAVN